MVFVSMALWAAKTETSVPCVNILINPQLLCIDDKDFCQSVFRLN